MPTVTTTVTSASATGTTKTVTTTEATPETASDEGFVYDGVIHSWVIGLPVETVAKYMHFDALGSTPVFKDAFAGLTCDGRAVGSIRRITLEEAEAAATPSSAAAAGMVVEEVCVATNPHGYSYALTDGHDIFSVRKNSYRGTFTCCGVNANTTTITWTNTYQTADAATSKAALEGFIPMMDAAWDALEDEHGVIPGCAINSPYRLGNVSTEWLNTALAPYLTKKIIGFTLQPVGETEGVAALSQRLTLTYSDESTGNAEAQTPTNPATAFIKVPSIVKELAQGLLGPYGFYAKEVRFYSDLSTVINPYLKVPTMLFGVIDPAPAAWKFCIILADLSEFGAKPGDDCVGSTLEQTMQINDALVKCQVAMHGNPVMDQDWLAPPHAYVRDVGAGLAACTPTFEEICKRKPSSAPMDYPAEVFEMFELFKGEGNGPKLAQYCSDTLDATPFMTLMRVDNRLENYMFNDSGDIWAVDWQVASKWSCAFDLAWWLNFSTNLEVAEKHHEEILHHYHHSLVEAGVTGYTYETFYKEYVASLIWITEWMVVCSVSQFVTGYKWGTDEADVEGGLTQKEIRVRELWNAVSERVFYGCIREKVLPKMKEICA